MSGRENIWTTVSGEALTEADATQLAEEFERDDTALDTANVTFPRKAGRPSLTGRAAASPRVSFRVTPELREQAERLAAERGSTVSQVARIALEDVLTGGISGKDLDEGLLDHLVVEFLEFGRRAVSFLRSASALLSMAPDLFPQQPALIAYCLREAMKAIPASASHDEGGGGQWKTKSRDVVEAKQRFETLKAFPGEDRDVALKDLFVKIDDMALTHEQDRIHQQRLIAVIVNRTGARPLAAGVKPVHAYQDVLDRLDTAVHGTVTFKEANQLWLDCLAILRQLFLPPDTRHKELEALAAIDNPSHADASTLLALVAGPNHLRYFLSKIRTPEWLILLDESGVLEPPAGQGPWPVFTAVEQLRGEHSTGLASVLAGMFDRWGSDSQKAWYLARAAIDLGTHGQGVILRAIRQHPTSSGIFHLAVWAAEQAESADKFVELVADHVLNITAWIEASGYPEPLLQALTNGINAENYAARIRLLCYKLRRVPQDDYERRDFEMESAGSLDSLPDDRRDQPFNALLRTLIESLRRAVDIAGTDEILDAISPLPSSIGSRVRAWLLGRASSAEPRELISEIARAVATRFPTGDDLPLIDRVVTECDTTEYVAQWYEALGTPPATTELGSALAARQVPREWLRTFQWSGLLPPAATAPWGKAIAIMSGVYGEPSRARLEQRALRELSWGQSPLNEADLRAMTTDDAARWIASWRPNPTDWLVSARELGRTLETVVKSDLARWASSPLKTASMLRHPTYIHHYLQGLAGATSMDELPIDEIVNLIELVHTHPWDTVPLGKDSFDFDPDWRPAEEASIGLIKSMCDSGIDFAEHSDEVWSVIQRAVERRDEPSHLIEGARDPLDSAINRACTRALQAALSFMGQEYRLHGTVRHEALDLLSSTLRLEGSDGEEHRAILAPSIAFLRYIASDWVDEHSDELFGSAAPAGVGQLTVDLALKWSQPNKWLLERFPNAVKDAVRREVRNALRHYVIAMLWQMPGYSVDQVFDFLRSIGRLSAAGSALGHLLQSEESSQEHVNLAKQLWEHAIDSGAAENLIGFGWFSEVHNLDDSTWTDLMVRTLTITHGRIDWAHRVAEGAAIQSPSSGRLAILNQLVRGLSDEWDRRNVTEFAVQALGRAKPLADTPEYQRLRTTLLERGALPSADISVVPEPLHNRPVQD